MGRRQQEIRTHSERYRETVRNTHLIANEMADLKDETEFSELLALVLAHWRNVRQQKRGLYISHALTRCDESKLGENAAAVKK